MDMQNVEADLQNVVAGNEFVGEAVVENAGNLIPTVARPTVKSVIVGGPVLITEPMSPIPASGSKTPLLPRELFKVLSFINRSLPASMLSYLSLLDIDPDTIIPSYFNDLPLLAHLACLLPPQNDDPQMDREALKQVLEEDDDLVEISAANFTPRKRRHVKVKDQLEDSFLRRSKRLSRKNAGFKVPRVPRKLTLLLPNQFPWSSSLLQALPQHLI